MIRINRSQIKLPVTIFFVLWDTRACSDNQFHAAFFFKSWVEGKLHVQHLAQNELVEWRGQESL